MVMNSASRHAEELEILVELREACDRIAAIDAKRAVELHAMLLAAVLVRAEHRLGIDLVFRLGVARVAAGEALLNDRLEFIERLAGRSLTFHD